MGTLGRSSTTNECAPIKGRTVAAVLYANAATIAGKHSQPDVHRKELLSQILNHKQIPTGYVHCSRNRH